MVYEYIKKGITEERELKCINRDEEQAGKINSKLVIVTNEQYLVKKDGIIRCMTQEVG